MVMVATELTLTTSVPSSRRRGYYGAFLMDNLGLIEELVTKLSKVGSWRGTFFMTLEPHTHSHTHPLTHTHTKLQAVSIPVSCKIRIFPDLNKTIEYARMVERSGCSLLAVHGRTRDQKNNTTTRADWDAIKAVKQVRGGCVESMSRAWRMRADMRRGERVLRSLLNHHHH
jgi:tRNA-dihydrouridine synthase